MRAAARWYEEQQKGLGETFLVSVERAVTTAAENPALGMPIGHGLRWLLTRRFRYAVIYAELRGVIHLLAVAHLRRRPGYWRERR